MAPLTEWNAHSTRVENTFIPGEDATQSKLRPTLAFAYNISIVREIIFWSLSLATGGLLLLFAFWFPNFFFKLRKKKCFFSSAKYILLYSDGNVLGFVKAEFIALSEKTQETRVGATSQALTSPSLTLYFEYAFLRYSLSLKTQIFHPVEFSVFVTPPLLAEPTAFSVEEILLIEERRKLFGNCVMDLPRKSIFTIIIFEILHPFYVFQIAAIALWISDEYYQYAGAIICITLISTIAELYHIRKQDAILRYYAHLESSVNIFRGKNTPPVACSSSQLVVGDIFELKRDMILPCDAILLTGSSLVDEAMLTGESVAILKNSLPSLDSHHLQSETLEFPHHIKSSLLFAGTKLLHLDAPHHPPVAMTFRVGFNTLRGRLLRRIVIPIKMRFDLIAESYRYLVVLFVVGSVYAIAALSVSLSFPLTTHEIIIRCLDIYTNALPPALPAALTVGISIAVARMKFNHQVVCVAPSTVNSSGNVTHLVFDKTGTLTSNGLLLEECVPVYTSPPPVLEGRAEEKTMETVETDDASTRYVHPFRSPAEAVGASSPCAVFGPPLRPTPLPSPPLLSPPPSASGYALPAFHPFSFQTALATCHALMVSEEEVIGEALEKEMLQFSQWKLLPNVAPPPRCSSPLNGLSPRALSPRASFPNLSLSSPLPSADAFSPPASSLPPSLSLPVLGTLENHFQHPWPCTYPAFLPEKIEEGTGGQASPPSFPLASLRLHILKRFEFQSSLQRMSVVVGTPSSNTWMAFCKGSPERIQTFCVEKSLPANVAQRIKVYANKGMRVLAMAGKIVDASAFASTDAISRDFVEKDLHFLGLMVFSTQLKAQTTPSIQRFRAANCFCAMATGDNALTAMAVAKECQIIPPETAGIVLLDDVNGKLSWKVLEQSSANLVNPTHLLMNTILEEVVDKCGKFTDSAEEYISSLKTPSVLTEGTSTLSLSRFSPSGGESGFPPPTKDFLSSIASFSFYFKQNSAQFKQISFVLTGAALRTLQAIHAKYAAILRFRETQSHSRKFWQSISPFATRAPTAPAESLKGTPPSQQRALSSFFYSWKTFLQFFSRWLSPTVPSSTVSTHGETLPLDAKENEKLPSESRELLTFSSSFLPSTASSGGFLPSSASPPSVETLKPTAITKGQRNSLWLPPQRATSTKPSSFLLDEMTVARSYVDFRNFLFETATVYARLSPMDKSSLIKSIQKLPSQPFVAMIGDGANDCDALNTADLSISLSDAEASIAANFKVLSKNIKNCVDLLIEGRAALVNSLQIFKFVFMYAMIETTCVLILYLYGTNFSDSQYVFIDVILILPLSIFMSWTYSSSNLNDEIPPKRLIELPIFFSIFGQSLIQILFQALALVYLSRTSFYVPFVPDENTGEGDGSELASFENSQIFLLSLWQYLSVCLAFSRNHPWRLSIWTNPLLTVWLLISAFFCIGFLLFPPVGIIGAIQTYFVLVPFPNAYNWIIFSIAIANIITTFGYEYVLYLYFFKFNKRKKNTL